MGIYGPTYAAAVSEAKKENPSRNKEEIIDVEFWDAPDENHLIEHKKEEDEDNPAISS